jgi:hypothetical protein
MTEGSVRSGFEGTAAVDETIEQLLSCRWFFKLRAKHAQLLKLWYADAHG